MALTYVKGWYLGFPESKTGSKRYFPRERTLIDPARYHWADCGGYLTSLTGPNGTYKYTLLKGDLASHHNEDPGDYPFYWMDRVAGTQFVRAAGSFMQASAIRDCYQTGALPYPPFVSCNESTFLFSSYSEGAYSDSIQVESFIPPNPDADWLTYFIGRGCLDPVREDALSSIMPAVLDSADSIPCDFVDKTWNPGEIVPTAYDPYTEQREIGKYFVADTTDLRPGSGVGYDVQRGGKYCWMPFIRFARKITWIEWSDYLTLDAIGGGNAERIISKERKEIVWEWDDSIGEWTVTTNEWYCGSKTQVVSASTINCKEPADPGPECPLTPIHTEDVVLKLTAQHLTPSPFTYYDLSVPSIPKVGGTFINGDPSSQLGGSYGGPYRGGRTPEVITPSSIGWGGLIERSIYSDFILGNDPDTYTRVDIPYDFIAPFCHGDV